MRESIGGTMLMMIVFSFLAVYIGFMAVIINYARAYRTKNSMLSYIESHEGSNGIEAAFPSSFHNSGASAQVCSIDNDKTVYFRVKVPVEFDIPFSFGSFGTKGGPVFWVSGETSAIKVPEGKDIAGQATPCNS